jgi:DNA invertase Pin-like site-specific DNA recombinase
MKASALVPVAQYVRMSTDHQKYSTENQSATNHEYAARRGLKIVRTYSDEGKSGLNLNRRTALKALIEDIQSGRADFRSVLVYDVSRWGRFQDVDESAYYEYVCKRAGIAIHYCAEQFENDDSSLSSIIKAVKRSMAAEYSRELSVKVFAGKSRLIKMGFRQGGSAGFGLRRMLVDEHGAPKGILKNGDHKSLATDRVILVPGPRDEVEIVRWIFSTFVTEKRGEAQIATLLNKKGISNDRGNRWSPKAVRYVLHSEKYIGNNVWNRESFKLQKLYVRNPPRAWLRSDGAFSAIIAPSLFEAAQARFKHRTIHPCYGPPRKYSDRELLSDLRRLFRRHRTLTKGIIDREGIQTSGAYKARFGGLTRAYLLAGFDAAAYRKRRRLRKPGATRLSDSEMLNRLSNLLRDNGYLTQSLIDETKSLPSHNAYKRRFGSVAETYRMIGYAPQDHRKVPRRLH